MSNDLPIESSPRVERLSEMESAGYQSSSFRCIPLEDNRRRSPIISTATENLSKHLQADSRGRVTIGSRIPCGDATGVLCGDLPEPVGNKIPDFVSGRKWVVGDEVYDTRTDIAGVVKSTDRYNENHPVENFIHIVTAESMNFSALQSTLELAGWRLT